MTNIKISELDELGVLSYQDEIPIVDVSEKETKKIKVHQFSDTIIPLTPVPIGTIFVYGGENAPDGYLFANGQEVSRIEYSDLFNVYGTIYGEGDGETTFNVPNLCGRVVVGTGQTQDISGETMTFENVGSKGGEFRHQLTINEMPSHDHQTTYYKNVIPTGTNSTQTIDYLSQNGSMNYITTGLKGQNQKHNNVQPYIVQNYIIKATNDSKTFTDTVVEQTEEFNQHVDSKINIFNQNASDKTDAFNLNVTTKTDEFNTNATNKVNDYNTNAENKVNEFNSNIDDLIQDVEDCYNNMLTNDVEGEFIHLEDSANAKVVELEIEGNSYQEVRSGKNLFDENGSIIIGKVYDATGSIVTSSDWNIFDDFIEIESDSTVTASAKINESVSSQFMIVEFDENKNFITRQSYQETTNRLVFTCTLGSTTKYIKFMYRNDTGMYDIQLELGDTATEYEQYGASPSPDYPSEIEVVKGYNLFDKDNLKTINGVPTNGSIVESANAKTFYIEIEPNHTYTVSREVIGSRFTVATTKEIPVVGSEILDNIVNNSASSITVTTSSESKYLLVYYLYNNTEDEEKILDNIQIIEGTIPKPYLPYQNIGVKITGKNLAKTTDCNLEGTGYSLFIKNGYINLSTTSHNGSFDLCGGKRTGDWLQGYEKVPDYCLTPVSQKKYVLSLKIDEMSGSGDINNSIRIFTNQRSMDYSFFPSVTSFEKSFTLKENEYVKGVAFWTNGSLTSFNFKGYIQLEEEGEQGEVATEFEPYQETITYIDLQDQEICKVGDIKDILRLKNGRVILTKNVGKVVLDGSEAWDRNSVTVNNVTYSQYYISLNEHALTNASSSHFIYKLADVAKGNHFYVNNMYNLLVFPHPHTSEGDIDTLEEFKTWLSENPVTVYYQLAEPYEVDLGEIKMPKTISNVTNITLLSTLETNMKLKYVRSTNVVIDNLAKAIVALGGEL